MAPPRSGSEILASVTDLVMLIPLVNCTQPLPAASKGEAAAESDGEALRRLGVAGPICLWHAADALGAAPSAAAAAALRESECIVGPFAPGALGSAREWLNAGARHVLLALEPDASAPVVAAVLEASGLPPERTMLLLQPAAELTEAGAVGSLVAQLCGLASAEGAGCYEHSHADTVGTVSGVLIALRPRAAGVPASRADEAENDLILGASSLAKGDRLQILVSGLRSRAGPAGVGELSKSGLHLVAPATLGGDAPAAAPDAAAPKEGAPAADAPAKKGAKTRKPPARRGAGSLDAVAEDASAAAVGGGVLNGAPSVPLPAGVSGDALLDVGRCLGACARSDRADGLLTTVVTELSGPALGLVYSSVDSLCAAIAAGRGVYWSRSRANLWRKGDTSGAWQRLVSARLDCDMDALLFTVVQVSRDR